MTLGQKLMVRLKELDITQTQLAKMTGIPQTSISNYINDKSEPNVSKLVKLAIALKVPWEFFFTEYYDAPATDKVDTRGLEMEVATK